MANNRVTMDVRVRFVDLDAAAEYMEALEGLVRSGRSGNPAHRMFVLDWLTHEAPHGLRKLWRFDE